MNLHNPKGKITPIDIELDGHPGIDAEATARYDQKVAAYLHLLHSRQSLLRATLWGVASAITFAVLWAAISLATGWQASPVALVLGLMVGLAVKFGGQGCTWPYRVVGGVCAMAGCILGNVLVMLVFGAKYYSMDIVEYAQLITLSETIHVFKNNFQGIDVAFYGGALYEGIRFSAHSITEGELQRAGMA